MVEVLAFWSPDGHSDYKLSMKIGLGRLGAPATGPRTVLTNVTRFFAVLCWRGKQLKSGLNALGRASEAGKDVRYAKKVDSGVRNGRFWKRRNGGGPKSDDAMEETEQK